MHYRTLGKTGYSVSTISFGAWAIGGAWGTVDDDTSLAALRKFVELGGNFIDTADVYGDGRSERLIAKVLKEHPDRIKVATKAGRRLQPHTAEQYTPANIESHIERSLKNLEVDSLDLVQLHCPPTPVYGNDALFDGLRDIQRKGKVRHWGVSVETIDEALQAIQYDNVCTVQIIFNAFRQRPADAFFDAAKQANVGILARVPLASGLLTGKFKSGVEFPKDDHRNFNSVGQQFDAGETFSGLGDHLDDAYAAVEALKPLVPAGQTLTQFALQWILSHDAVTCAIPGAKNAEQAAGNVAASDLPPLTGDQLAAVRKVYDRYIRPMSMPAGKRPCSVLLLAALAGCHAAGRSSLSTATDPPADVIVLDNHWHTALIFESDDLPPLLRGPPVNADNRRYVMIGWATRAFSAPSTSRPAWSPRHCSTAAAACFWPSRSTRRRRRRLPPVSTSTACRRPFPA